MPGGQLAITTFFIIGIRVPHNLLLHLQDDLIDEWIVQNHQIEQILGVSSEAAILSLRH